MELTLWTYEGPPHVGTMRIATAMEGVHYVLHAPQGDTYADLLFTMIERRDRRPPVSYTTFQARDLGGDTAEMVKTSVREAYERFKPQVMLVGESCTAELIQDQPGSLAKSMGLPVPVVGLELPAYSKKRELGRERDALSFSAIASFSKKCYRQELKDPNATQPFAPKPTSLARLHLASAAETTFKKSLSSSAKLALMSTSSPQWVQSQTT